MIEKMYENANADIKMDKQGQRNLKFKGGYVNVIHYSQTYSTA